MTLAVRGTLVLTSVLLSSVLVGCSQEPDSTGRTLQTDVCQTDLDLISENEYLTYNPNPEGVLFIAGGSIDGAAADVNLYQVFAELVTRQPNYELVNLPAAQADATDEDEGDANREEIQNYKNEHLDLLGV